MFDGFCKNKVNVVVVVRESKEDHPRLAEALREAPQFSCPQGTVWSGIEGLCLVLNCLAYMWKYFDLIYRFACPVPELCMIYNVGLDWIYITHGHGLTSWNQLFLTPAWLEQYAQATHQLGCPLANCLGFIDSNIPPILQLEEHKRLVYNGHKPVYSLQFQSLFIPNGLRRLERVFSCTLARILHTP